MSKNAAGIRPPAGLIPLLEGKQSSQEEPGYCSRRCSHSSKDNFPTITSVIPSPGDGLTSFEAGSAALD